MIDGLLHFSYSYKQRRELLSVIPSLTSNPVFSFSVSGGTVFAGRMFFTVTEGERVHVFGKFLATFKLSLSPLGRRRFDEVQSR